MWIGSVVVFGPATNNARFMSLNDTMNAKIAPLSMLERMTGNTTRMNACAGVQPRLIAASYNRLSTAANPAPTTLMT